MAASISADNGTSSGSAGIKITSDNTGVLALQSGNNTTAITVDTSQNVGIGISSPISKFNVKQPNNTSIGSLLGVSSSADDSTLYIGYRSDIGGMIMSPTYASTGSYQPLIFRTSDTNRMTIDTSGNVGIGTTSPAGRLHVSTTGSDVEVRSATTTANYATFRLKNSTNDYSMQIRTDQSNAWVLRDEQNTTNRLFVNTSGYVGISKSPNSLAMLEVKANSSSIYQLFLEQNNTEHGWQFLADQTDGYLKFYRRDGSGSTKRFEFQSGGSAYSSTGTWGTLSDARLKENIVDATPKLDAVMQLKVRNYNLIGEELKQIGFVAQEIEQVFPSVAETERNYDGTVKEDGIKSVKTTVLIPILVKAIQELKAINDQQAETINALTARIVALEGK